MTASMGWFDGSPRSPCSIDGETREQVASELAASPDLLAAYRRLTAEPLGGQWQEAVGRLEAAVATWSVGSCLCHPSADVQLVALRAIRRLRDPRLLDLLVRYAETLGGPIAGSEESTLRIGLRSEAEQALEALTGSPVHLAWDDPAVARADLDRLRAESRQRESRGFQ